MKAEIRIRDEETLLLGLCQLEFSDKQAEKIRTLANQISDWDYFSTLANNHGVAAIVYHNLEKLHLLTVMPEQVKAFLRGALMRNLSRNAFNSESMVQVLRLLNNENIKTVLLKGFALENSVYGNEGLRQMSDVDVLIRRDQCIKARNILIRNGFVSLPLKSFLHRLIIAYIGKHLPTMTRNGTSVEIHNELFGGRKSLLTRMLYENSEVVEINGEKAYIPQPQIFFLYLVRHLWMHEMNNESQLRLYADLVILIAKYRDEIINYDLLTLASQAGISEILACRLELLRDLWGMQFPGWIDDFIDRWYNSGSINKFIFFLKSPKGNPPLDKARYYRNIINDIPGFHHKLLFLLGDIFPSVRFMKNRYNCTSSWKVMLYYPYRIGKIWWLIKR